MAVNLPRFSEDLDFSLVAAAEYDPVRWLQKLKRDLYLAGFDRAIRWIDRRPVQAAWIRTAGGRGTPATRKSRRRSGAALTGGRYGYSMAYTLPSWEPT